MPVRISYSLPLPLGLRALSASAGSAQIDQNYLHILGGGDCYFSFILSKFETLSSRGDPTSVLPFDQPSALPACF